MSTELIAKIKKIDINNKVFKEKWEQTITITLSDIELNDENLVTLTDFRPNEEILVSLSKLQMTFGEIAKQERLKNIRKRQGKIDNPDKLEKKEKEPEEEIEYLNEKPEDEELIFDLDYEEIPETDKILKTFDFS